MGITIQNNDEYWMEQALKLAQKAEAGDEVPVGALIVKDGELYSEGFNCPIQNHDPTAHAEIIAIKNAAKTNCNYRMTGHTTLYVTLEPCIMCVGAIIHARISRVVFAAYDLKTGAAGSAFSLLTDEKNNHRVMVTGGVLEQASSSLIKSFFKSKR